MKPIEIVKLKKEVKQSCLTHDFHMSARPPFARDDGEAHGDRARLDLAIVCRRYPGEARATRAALPTNQRILRRFRIAGVLVNRYRYASQLVWMTLGAR